jgi:glyoxylase-like metal-dependent hydrolase (beta-lactamase superfamily II)
MKSIASHDPLDAPWTEIAPGVFTWEAFHPEWGKDVRCAAYLSPRSVVLIDPLTPPGSSGKAFWKILDRLILSEERLLRILLTIFYHERSTPDILSRYGDRVRVWCPAGGRDLSITARRFHAGVRLPAGIQAIPTARKFEVLFWIPRANVLFSGDAILGGKRRPLRLCPGSWNPKGVTQADLADSLEPVRNLPVQVVHVGHGSPVTSSAHGTLISALDAAKKRG